MFNKLKNFLSKTSSKISDSVSSIFSGNKLTNENYDQIEEALISADIGILNAENLIQKIKKLKTKEEILNEISSYIYCVLKNYEFDDDLISNDVKNSSQKVPYVIVMVGVNGSGKTTTAAKLAYYYKTKGLKTRMAACDTFRAAATEQLKFWGENLQIPVTYADQNSDPASVAYRAFCDSVENSDDVLIIDTAGRIHNRDDLMDELAKIMRVLKKKDENIPNDIFLVLDGVVGQSAIFQARPFVEKIHVTGLILTKLDGTAKGGAAISIVENFQLPIAYIGVGEKKEDFKKFNAEEFAKTFSMIDF